MSATTCRSCGAAIWWATSRLTGTRVPLDHEPDLTALLALVEPDGSPTPAELIWDRLEEGRAVVGSAAGLPPEWPRWGSHFATCPQAGNWRRRR